MTVTDHDSLTEAIKRLARRSSRTYKCRLHAHHRLSRANHAWNAAMIAFATSTTIASVGILVDRGMYGAGGDAMLLALAILSLVASLVVSSVSLGTRSQAMESNYKRLQQVAVAAENLVEDTEPDKRSRYERLQYEYDMAIEASENHTDADYRAMLAGESGAPAPRERLGSRLARMSPFLTMLVPLALLAPFGLWFAEGF